MILSNVKIISLCFDWLKISKKWDNTDWKLFSPVYLEVQCLNQIILKMSIQGKGSSLKIVKSKALKKTRTITT